MSTRSELTKKSGNLDQHTQKNDFNYFVTQDLGKIYLFRDSDKHCALVCSVARFYEIAQLKCDLYDQRKITLQIIPFLNALLKSFLKIVLFGFHDVGFRKLFCLKRVCTI